MPTRLTGPIIKLDLLQPTHLQVAIDLINNRVLIQPADTPMPPPLRDDSHPNGLPWLTPDQKECAGKANRLYAITCQLIRLCSDGILWSCENPGRSFMWQTTPLVDLFPTLEYMFTELHH